MSRQAGVYGKNREFILAAYVSSSLARTQECRVKYSNSWLVDM
jgi:hypothetical protein